MIIYFIVFAVILAMPIIGSIFTSLGIKSGWYNSIRKPSWTPPGKIFGAVWTTIFVLCIISSILFLDQNPKGPELTLTSTIFFINALLNISWSWLFFAKHKINVALIGSAILDLSVIALILLIWPVSSLAAILLIPYAVWVAFATYLNYKVYKMNSLI